jgi:hypothetical protein
MVNRYLQNPSNEDDCGENCGMSYLALGIRGHRALWLHVTNGSCMSLLPVLAARGARWLYGLLSNSVFLLTNPVPF